MAGLTTTPLALIAPVWEVVIQRNKCRTALLVVELKGLGPAMPLVSSDI